MPGTNDEVEVLQCVALEVLKGRRRLDKPSVCCRVCGCLTLDGLYQHEICVVCDWHEDGTDDGGPADCGPHYGVSFTEAKENFRLHLTSRNPTEGQRFLRSLPLRPLKNQFLELQQSLYEAARRHNIDEAARIYDSICETIEQITRARVPSMSITKQQEPRNN